MKIWLIESRSKEDGRWSAWIPWIEEAKFSRSEAVELMAEYTHRIPDNNFQLRVHGYSRSKP